MKSSLSSVSTFLAFAALVATSSFAAEPGKAPEPNYVYKAELADVVDGATIVLNVDLGFHVWLHDETLRLDGITAPSFKGEDKEGARKWKTALEGLLEGRKLVIQTKKDKTPNPPTRFLVTVWADGENVNEALAKAVK